MSGRGARVVVLTVPAAVYFFSYFHRVAPAVVATDLMRAFAISAASLGSLVAIYPYVFVVMALVAGSLADTLGPRWTLALGGATMGLGAAVFGVAPSFAMAFGGRLLVGLGASVVLIAWLSLAAAWFRPAEFGTVSGFTQAVGNVGALVASSPLALLVEAVGWRQTFVMIGGLTVLLAGAVAALVRDRPEALGLPPVTPPRSTPSVRETLAAIPGVVRNARTWPPILAAGGVYIGLITFMGLWGVPYLVQIYGLTRVEAASVVALAPAGLCVGSPLVGWLSDRWLGLRRLPMAICTLLFATCWAPLLLPPDLRLSVGSLAPFVFLMGFTASAVALVWPCVREVNNPAQVGLAIGFVNMPIFLAFAVMQWLTGVILDAHWAGLSSAGVRIYPVEAYRALFLLCFGIAAAALVAAWFVTETRCRNVWQPAATTP
ncbi:MAG TPA: MFS transporter [Methylomirabilota bacterium]